MTKTLTTGPFNLANESLSHGDPYVMYLQSVLSESKMPTPAAMSYGNFILSSLPNCGLLCVHFRVPSVNLCVFLRDSGRTRTSNPRLSVYRVLSNVIRN